MRLFHVIAVEMGIATSPDKITHFKVTLLRHHMYQQRVAGNVEWQAKEHIAGALVKLTRQLAIGNVELEESVTRR
ncbi:hypothetical protein D3C78_933310 [compost metagenome]